MRKNKFFAILSLLVVLCLSAVVLTCCGKTGESGAGTGESASVKESASSSTLTLTRNSVQLIYGETAVVVAKYKDEDGKTLVWKSSDETVATVDGGVIYSVGLGEAAITAVYGNQEAVCNVSVSYGEYQPTLKVDYLGDELTLLKGDEYELVSHVIFNGKDYPCGLSVKIADETIATFENGKIRAAIGGETEVTLKGVWNGFDTPLMEKTVTLKVIDNDVAMYMHVEKDGEEEVADELTLYVTDSFEGETYANEASVKFVIKENGTEKNGLLSVTEGSDVITLDNGHITASSIGDAVITATYENADGIRYSKELRVNVICPVVVYKEHVEWTDETVKDITKLNYFASGARVLYARQGNRKLGNTRKMITGVIFNGDKTEPVEVQTSKGGYIFEDIYGCNTVLTNENFASVVTLGSGDNNKYYALGEDIGTPAAPVDMKNQNNASANACFSGTFDGRGHTVYAGTYENGIFGGYGYGAVIKNAKFVITFMTANANGITSDRGRWAMNPKMSATIENVHIVTTNFNEGNHVVSELKVELLKMKDVLIEVNGAENIRDYDGRDNVSLLFGTDLSYYGFMVSDAGLECFDNVRVVANKFLPIANGSVWNGSKFLTFAVNDESEFGAVKRNSESRNSYRYCTIVEAERHSEWFRDVIYGKTPSDEYEHVNSIYICYALQKMENGGIYRYNTTDDLKKVGVTQVGDWVVA